MAHSVYRPRPRAWTYRVSLIITAMYSDVKLTYLPT